jgi:hypothetical protein
MLDAMSDAQQRQSDEKVAIEAAPPAPPAPLTPEEMAALERRRLQVRNRFVLPALAILMVACASFYSGTLGIPSTLFALGFVVWVIGNRMFVCPRCGAPLLGRAEKKTHCHKCGVQLKPE